MNQPTGDEIPEEYVAAFGGEEPEEAAPAPQPVEAAPVEPEAAPEPQTPPEPPEDLYEFNGNRYPKQMLAGAVEFYEWARQHPNEVGQIASWLDGKARLVPIGEEPPSSTSTPVAASPGDEPDPFEDLPAPVRDKLAKVDALEQGFAKLQQAQQQAVSEANVAAIANARSSFANRYALSEDEARSVLAKATSLGIIPALVANAKGDVARGVEDAMESAYYLDPANRDKVIEQRMRLQQQAQARQRNASRLSGSSGASPRPTKPLSKDDAHEQMIEQIALAMRGESVE
jgi:hypothetical protein